MLIRWHAELLQNEMTKCEICDKDILLRLYAYHMRQIHRPKDEVFTEVQKDVANNLSFGRGSRAAAQKCATYHLLFAFSCIAVLNACFVLFIRNALCCNCWSYVALETVVGHSRGCRYLTLELLLVIPAT